MAHRQHPHSVHAHHPPRHQAKAASRHRSSAGRRIAKAVFCKKCGRVSALKVSGFGVGTLAVLYGILVAGLMQFDVAGPIVKRALEAKLGKGTHVEIGQTTLGQNASGQPVLVVRNIVIKGRKDIAIATAPRAEITLDSGVLVGNFRAKRIELVDAVMTLRIDESGRIGITAEDNPQQLPLPPQAPAPAAVPPPSSAPAPTPAPAPGSAENAAPSVPAAPGGVPFVYPEFAAWLDRLEQSGLDGIALSEVGLRHGTLVVDSARRKRRWVFADTNFSVARPEEGGVTMSLSSGKAADAWSINATISALQNGARAIDVVARDISPEDLMLAAGATANQLSITSRLSGILRAQIGQDGKLLGGGLRASASPGEISNSTDDDSRITIDGIQLQAEFNPNRRAILFDPVLFQAGANRISLQAVIEAPKGQEHAWPISIFRGRAQLGSGRPMDPSLMLDQIQLQGTWDPVAQRLALNSGTIAGPTAALAASGAINFGGPMPTLQLGVASNELSVSAAKHLWPAPIAPGARTWIVDHFDRGILSDFLLAVSMPLDKVGVPNVELPDDAVKIVTNVVGGEFRPLAELPPIREAQIKAVVTGRTVEVTMPKGTLETRSGRRFSFSDGKLEILNHAPPNPRGTIQFHFGGPADAVAETVNYEPIHSALGITFDPASTKGTVQASANFDLTFKKDPDPKKDMDYTFDVSLANFASDNIVGSQRVDGLNAKLALTPTEITVKGDGKIADAPSQFEYRKSRDTGEASFKIAATLDDAARAHAGFDLAPWLTGPVAVKAQGQIDAKNETRMEIDADLGGAKIVDLVPGWLKMPGRSTRASFKLSQRDGNYRIDDLNVSGAGTALRGSLELEQDGDVVSANFPTFQLSDGDRASLRAERGSDGTLKATVRGDVLDIRALMKRMTEGSVQTGPVQGKRYQPHDLNLEVKVGAASGNNGEVVRQLDFRVLRRNSEIRDFSLLGKIGRDSTVVGELRQHEGRSAIYISSNDAGALFRFSDYYSKIQGGDSWILIDTPRFDGSPQEGTIQVRNFTIRGESALDRLVGVQQDRAGGGLPFRRLQVNFSRTPGRFNIREALFYGDAIGATCSGVLDYSNNTVSLRGTYIPAYGLNNAAGRALFFLGTPSNEGLFAYTFDIVGPASGPTLHVNPISGVMPGMFRKLFDFRSAPDEPPGADMR